MNELKQRINLDERQFLTMIGQLDRKNDNKVTWTEFLNFLTNEGVRRETVNDANLYGYGVKRLTHSARHHLRLVDQFNGPEKLAEYYIDGMILIKLKNARLLLNLFENKEAKLFDLRTLQPVQHLIFSSDYAKPKPKKVEPRRKTIVTEGALGSLPKQIGKSIPGMLQSFVLPGGVGPSAPSEMGDSTSMASLNHMVSGILQFGDETPANVGTVEGNFNDQNASLQYQANASGELHP